MALEPPAVPHAVLQKLEARQRVVALALNYHNHHLALVLLRDPVRSPHLFAVLV